MRKNISDVVSAFISGRVMGGKTLSTADGTIYSYDMPIAVRRAGGGVEVIDREKGPTATTRSHIAGVHFALEQSGHSPKVVSVLFGHGEHAFRDRAGQDGYLGRTNARRPAVAAPRRALKLVK